MAIKRLNHPLVHDVACQQTVSHDSLRSLFVQVPFQQLLQGRADSCAQVLRPAEPAACQGDDPLDRGFAPGHRVPDVQERLQIQNQHPEVEGGVPVRILLSENSRNQNLFTMVRVSNRDGMEGNPFEPIVAAGLLKLPEQGPLPPAADKVRRGAWHDLRKYCEPLGRSAQVPAVQYGGWIGIEYFRRHELKQDMLDLFGLYLCAVEAGGDAA
jgi:hypothetical protein